MLKSIKFIVFCLVSLCAFVACEKEALIVDNPTAVAKTETPRGPLPEFMIYSYNSTTGFSSPAVCTFSICDALPSGLSSFSTVLSGGQYSNYGYVGHTYYSNPLWFNKEQTYLLIPEGTFPKKCLRINYNASYTASNMPTIKYNKYTKTWSVTGGANYTSSVLTVNSADMMPC
ncbi:MAG: hypothetical protein JNM36_02805 [Chitinophagales bacterium]|jgi:hypothetical protein|nr:hypothetical protein [Chitinophagales bacterium]